MQQSSTITTLLALRDNQTMKRVLQAPAYSVTTFSHANEAMESLRYTQYDLIVLEDSLFSGEITSVVAEMKRRSPFVPVLVVSHSPDSAFQTDLMEAGADDVFADTMSVEECQRRLQLIIRQRAKARMLAERNQHLQFINLLARKMHSSTDQYTLIQETIARSCQTFDLYGMALTLREGDAFHLYIGRENATAEDGLYENLVYLKEFDPYMRVIRSGVVEVFQTINTDPYYSPAPILPTPQSAIILPLDYQDERLGALAVFGQRYRSLTEEDLLVYELLAAQFAVALNNARSHRMQRVSVESSERILDAWRRFVSLGKDATVSETLRTMVEDIPSVTHALVWMYGDPVSQSATQVTAHNEETANIFQRIEADGQLMKLIQQLDSARTASLSLQLNAGQRDPLAPLFRALQGQQIIVVPITDSARFIGGIIASVVNTRQFFSEDTRRVVAGLAYAAALSLERATLIENMIQKSGRLEALLVSTSQGIFFVDENHRVSFVNPQFTEKTGINPSDVLGQPPERLFEYLAGQTTDVERVRKQLEDTIVRLLQASPDSQDYYPIVEIPTPERGLQLELIVMGDDRSSWAGFVRDQDTSSMSWRGQSVLLDRVAEQVRVSAAQVRGLLGTLQEQHSRFTHRERSRFLKQADEGMERLSRLWDNVVETTHLETVGLSIADEDIDLLELIQRVLESQAFRETRRMIQIEALSTLPPLAVDEARMEHALHNVLDNAVRFSPKGAPIQVTVQEHGEEVYVIVRDQGAGIAPDVLNRLFEPFYTAEQEAEGLGLGLYVTREIVERHGGALWVESGTGKGTTVTISLPVLRPMGERSIRPTPSIAPIVTPPAVQTQPLSPPPMPQRRPEVVEEPRPAAQPPGRRVTERQPQTIMAVQGRSTLVGLLSSKLEEQGYEVITYSRGEEAVRDVNTVRFDLILVDVHLPDANGLDVCERLGKRTEVPLIMLADAVSEPEKVRALMIGADDYIAKPISDDELMARVNVIIKRRRIPDRTREPLDLGNLYIDFARREVFLNGKPLELTRIEYDLLHTLSVNQGQVLTHKQLLEKVWGPEYQAETQYLWVNVSRLRKKLEPTVDSPRYIHTQPGVGYVFRPS